MGRVSDVEPHIHAQRHASSSPRSSRYRYEVKWEGYPSSDNTWEPVAHLEGCMGFVKAFEKGAASGSKKK